MPRPPPRRLQQFEEEDETTQQVPAARRPRRASSGLVEPLAGVAKLLAVATLLMGSCGGLASGFEAIGHGSGHEFTQSIKAGHDSMSYVVPTQDNTVATVGVAFRLLFALGCLAAAVFAGLALGQSSGAGVRAALAYVAAGLATVRLFVAGIDWILVEQAVELARNDARRSAGYSYAQAAAGLSAAEDFGTSAMLIIGIAVVIFWAIASVVFWPTKSDAESAVDRMA